MFDFDNAVFEGVCWCDLCWLVRPMFALNCLLQIEQVSSENDDSDDDLFALALRSFRFRSASQISSYFVVICSLSGEATPLSVHSVPRTMVVC